MKYNADLVISKSVDWSTPKDLYDYFVNTNGFIDPCPLNSKINGLAIDYYKKNLFINPPFSDLKVWVDYIFKQYRNGCNIVLLMPARTDTIYFHKLLTLAPSIYFFDKRLKFGDAKSTAPFPTILVVLWHSIFSLTLYNYGNIKKLIDSRLYVK